jgi:hypothetical protein
MQRQSERGRILWGKVELDAAEASMPGHKGLAHGRTWLNPQQLSFKASCLIGIDEKVSSLPDDGQGQTAQQDKKH